MSLFRHINEISDKGSLKVRGSMMQAIARTCLDIITRTKEAPYNWDVIALYCAPPNASHKQKERYDGVGYTDFLFSSRPSDRRRISLAKVRPNFSAHSLTVWWETMIPRAARKSSTIRRLKGKR